MVDQVMKVAGDDHVYAKLNNIGQTNLLIGGQSATRQPLRNRVHARREPRRPGRRRAGPVNMPSNQWVMSSVVLNSDSRQPCPAPPVPLAVTLPQNCTTQDFNYTAPWSGKADAYFDPVEREHYGYFVTKTIFPSEDQGHVDREHLSKPELLPAWSRDADELVPELHDPCLVRGLVSGYWRSLRQGPNRPVAVPPHTGTLLPCAEEHNHLVLRDGRVNQVHMTSCAPSTRTEI